MIFEPERDLRVIILLGASLLFGIGVIFLYFRRIYRVSRAVKRHTSLAHIQNEEEGINRDDGLENDPTARLPKASVLVYSRDRADNLRTLLPQLLAQRYSPGYEVIVVNDGESEETTLVVDRLRASHPNLYLTFTPDGARNVSRKKLALMIGIKAAHNPVVVNTTGDADIGSPYWLARMMRHFADPDVEIVLGYSRPNEDYEADTGLGARTRAFDHVADAVAWLASALGGQPYRGTEFNLAYTRDIFFNNKGFSRSLNLRHGDDDIFVSEIVRPHNAAIELSSQSHARTNFYSPKNAHDELRASHRFTSRNIGRMSRAVMGAGVWLLLLSVVTAAVAAVLGLPNYFASVIAAVIVLAELISLVAVWSVAMRRLHGRRLLLTLPFLALTYPIRRTVLTIRSMRRRSKNYTWTH